MRTMKSSVSLLSFVLLLSGTARSLDLSALEGMLSNDSMFSGGGDWVSGGSGWDDFGGSGSDPWGGGGDDWGAPVAAKKKEAPKLKEVGSDKERFLQDMPDGTGKLPKQHKEVAREYLNGLVGELRGLHAELTSMKLRIALQEELQKTADALPTFIEKLELVSSKSSYLLTLFRKEFNGTRKKIIDATKEATKAKGAFTDMPTTADSNDFFSSPAPTGRHKRAESDAKKKSERLVTGPLKRLQADLEKVVDHQATKRSLESKKKSHTTPTASEGSGAWGGGGDSWGSDAGGDWEGAGGFGSFGDMGGGWGDDDFFGGMSGGGDDWGMSDMFGGGDWGGGGYDNWGGSSDLGGGSSSYDSSGSYDSGGSESSSYSGDTESTASEPRESSSNDDNTINVPRLPSLDGMEGDERTEHLAQGMSIILKQWQDKFAAANDVASKQKVIRNMLADSTFVSSLRKLNELAELLDHKEEVGTEGAHRALEKFHDQMVASAPLLVHGVKYTVPLLGNEQEARELYAAQDAAAEKKTIDKARKAVGKRIEVRKRAELFLGRVLGTILNSSEQKLQGVLYKELKAYEASRLDQLELMGKKMAREMLNLEDSGNLLLATMGVLERPTTADFARALPASASKDELKAAKKEAEEMSKRVHTLQSELIKQLQAKEKLSNAIHAIMGEALPAAAKLDTASAIEKATSAIEKGLTSSSLSSAEKDIAREMLLPASSTLINTSLARMRAQKAALAAWLHNKKVEEKTEPQDTANRFPRLERRPSSQTPAPGGGDGLPSDLPEIETPEEAPRASTDAPQGASSALSPALSEKIRSLYAPRPEGESAPAVPAGAPDEEMDMQDMPADQQGMMQMIQSNPAMMEVTEKMQRGELTQEQATSQLQALMGG